MLNMHSLLLPTLLLLGALLPPRLVQSFAPTTSLPCCRQLVGSSVQLDAATKATLTEETLWKIRFVLKGVETTKGKKVDEIIRIEANFVEEEGYEPPQGTVQQIPSSEDRLKITKSYWQLSEDPNDRKDGLWVWGLFKEPLYPYLLLRLETDAIPLENNDKVDMIKPLQLFAQIDHRRDAESGVVLYATDLKVRQMETVKADIFGVADVDVYEEVNVGTLSIQPAVPVEK